MTMDNWPTPEAQKIIEQMKEFDKANPNFWCKCGNPETGNIYPRGHSVDVDCKNCGGFIQIG